jgi:hypothetical protein
VISIPIAVDGAPFVDQITNLDGTDFRLAFRYNQREARYYVTIGHPDGTDYTTGAALVCSWPLFANTKDPRMPPGRLLVLPQGGDSTAPGLGELGPGKRCELFYFSPGELAAAGAI